MIAPSLGLYWIVSSDPTAGAGVPAPLNQLLIRSDDMSIYYKSSSADTGWTKIGVGSSIGGTQFWGDASDGNVTYGAGTTTTLTRDMAYDTITVEATAILNTGGFRIFARNALIEGTVDRSGNGGGNNGAGPQYFDAGVIKAAGTLAECVAGGAGGNTPGGATGNGGNSTGAPEGFVAGRATATTSNPTVNQPTGDVGQGGAGGGGYLYGTLWGAATVGGLTTVSTAVQGGGIRAMPSLLTGRRLDNNVLTGGTGGGGGRCGDVGARVGGGGGGGGGILIFNAQYLEGSGVIRANGGAGCFGIGASGNPVVGGFGGGGGGGGVAIVFTQTPSASFLATVQANGGAGGVGGNNTSNGQDGGTGGVGIVKLNHV